MIDIATYLDRITSEHKVQPKFMGLVAARLQPFIDLFECLEEMDKAFDLDTAEGEQLDVIGEYVGVKRLLNFQPEYADAVLTDPYYRMLLKAQISLNNWDGSVEGIKKIWGDVFPEYEIQIVDNQNMTMEARIIGLRQLFESELVQHGYITPKPMGVGVDYTVVMSIEVDTELFLGALNTHRIGTVSLPPDEPPEDNEKPSGVVYAAGGNPTLNVMRETEGKSPPESVTVKEAEIYAQSFKAAEFLTVMTQSKSPPESVLISAAREHTGSLLSAQNKRSDIEKKETAAELKPPLIDGYSSAAALAAVIKRSTIKSKVRS